MEKREEKKSIVVEGRTVEEALQAACDMLETTPNQVDYEVSESNRNGMLGFLRGKVFKVKVWEKSPAERMLRELVAGLFERMGFPVRFKITQVDDAFEIDLETEGSDGLLIGRGGETLTGIQHLISRMASHNDEELRVRVDIAGYRKRRHDLLRRKATDLAERAIARGRDVLTEPLPADERRIIHLALADDNRVATRAVGEGAIKRIAVVPQSSARSGSGRSSGERPQRSIRESSRESGRESGREPMRESRGERDSEEFSRRPLRSRSSGGDRERGGRGSRAGSDRRGSSWQGRSSGVRPERSRSAACETEPANGAAEEERRPNEKLEDLLVGRRERIEARAENTEMRSNENSADESCSEDEQNPNACSRIFQLPDESDAYFRMPSPDEGGDRSEPSSAETAEPESGDADKPITYGRRPHSGGRRRRR